MLQTVLTVFGVTGYVCIGAILYRNLLSDKTMHFYEKLISIILSFLWPTIPFILFVIILMTSSQFRDAFDDLFE